jgi:hypothetical protein
MQNHFLNNPPECVKGILLLKGAPRIKVYGSLFKNTVNKFRVVKNSRFWFEVPSWHKIGRKQNLHSKKFPKWLNSLVEIFLQSLKYRVFKNKTQSFYSPFLHTNEISLVFKISMLFCAFVFNKCKK